jgi:hypothetical protein
MMRDPEQASEVSAESREAMFIGQPKPLPAEFFRFGKPSHLYRGVCRYANHE